MTLSTRRIGVATAVAAVLLTLVWYAALFRPQSARIKAANQAHAAATAQIAQLETQIGTLQALERQIPADKAKLAQLDSSLPKSSDLKDVLNQLHTLATADGVQLTAVNPSPTTPSGQTGSTATASALKTVQLTMSVHGAYQNTMSFLSGLAHVPRTFVVDSASFSPATNGSLTTSLTARIFYAS